MRALRRPCFSRFTLIKRAVTTTSNESHTSYSGEKEKPVQSAPQKQKIQIAVVGSGPSGCFVATSLTKRNPLIHVDILEKMPVPFGLCRYGVSPDHPDVKNVEKQFTELFRSGRVTWIGNVRVGVDISLPLLLSHYAAVVFATGADSSATLNIPGRELDGVLTAHDVVSNYNTYPYPYGSPRFSPIPFDRASRVAVIGNGNVAMDIVRVVAANYKYFAPTDMNCYTVRALMKNQIHAIDVIARRGVEYSAFSIASFRELTTLERERIEVKVDDFSLEEAIKRLPSSRTNARAHRRLMELVHQCAVSQEDPSSNGLVPFEFQGTEPTTEEAVHLLQRHASAPTKQKKHMDDPTIALPRGPCAVRFRYGMSPVRYLPSHTNSNRLGGILVECKATPDDTRRYAVLPCDVAIQSIGYHISVGETVRELPVESSTGRLVNADGRVKGLPRVYCSGWAKNGCKGVIMHSLHDAQETAKSILEDIEKKVIPVVGEEVSSQRAESKRQVTTMQGKFGLLDYFVAKKLQPVSVKGLERIFYVEKNRGVDLGKRLEKMDSVQDMLDVALGGEVGKKTAQTIRGITPTRPAPLMYLKELLDDETDLSAFAHNLAKDLPQRLAASHPPGPISPSQL